jgi:hypothetical protein
MKKELKYYKTIINKGDIIIREKVVTAYSYQNALLTLKNYLNKEVTHTITPLNRSEIGEYLDSLKALHRELNGFKSAIELNNVRLKSFPEGNKTIEEENKILYQKLKNKDLSHLNRTNTMTRVKPDSVVCADGVERFYYVALLKFGHADRRSSFYLLDFAFIATTKEDVKQKAKNLPRGKKNHKDYIRSIKQVSKQEYEEVKKFNLTHPFFTSSSKQEYYQKMQSGEFPELESFEFIGTKIKDR